MTSITKQDSGNNTAEVGSIRKYYDDNTKLFLNHRANAASMGIHQPLFVRDGMTLQEAMHVHHDVVLTYLHSNPQATSVLDLGCGVGASMLYIASHTDEHVHLRGVTISEKQRLMGQRHIREMGMDDRVAIDEASYLALPNDIVDVHTAYAIESFIHCTDVKRFFGQVAERLVPSGRLFVFDDFVTNSSGSPGATKILRDFREGWGALNLLPLEEIVEAARTSGMHLLRNLDFTDTLKLNRPRDKFVQLIAPVAALLKGRSQYARFLVGGNARQAAFTNNFLTYRLLEFEKR